MQLPLLEIDNHISTQSSATLRKLGIQLGYYPYDPAVLYEVDWAISTIDDYFKNDFTSVYTSKDPPSEE